MSLQISTTPALIGIQTTPGQLSIQQPKADIELNIQHPKLEIHTEQIKVQIDQYQCFAESGLKNFLDLTRDNAAFAQQKVAQAIERIVRQGNELAAIETGVNPIPAQAVENAFEHSPVDFNMGTMPMSRPKIDFVGGNVDIQFKEGKVDSKVQINRPIVDYTRGKVDIYLRQRNNIQIEYIGKNLNIVG